VQSTWLNNNDKQYMLVPQGILIMWMQM